MGAGRIPRPGTKYGPCSPVVSSNSYGGPPALIYCKHLDCQRSREDAAALCAFCDKAIGYETPFYSGGEDVRHFHGRDALVHALCLELAVEKEQNP
jgi:hypothetical protein